jgi:hypothetical protein
MDAPKLRESASNSVGLSPVNISEGTFTMSQINRKRLESVMLKDTPMAHTPVMERKGNTIAGIAQCAMNHFTLSSFG